MTDHPEITTDIVAVEEPLEIRLATEGETKKVSITMRTPGHDEELALGFLFTEGIISDYQAVQQVDVDTPTGQFIEVGLRKGESPRLNQIERNFYTTSSCGVCGKASLDAVRVHSKYRNTDNPIKIRASVLSQLPASALLRQGAFNQTGGLHASALFDSAGSFALIREDVGRHNALDKVIGHSFAKGLLPLKDSLLLLSGRISFELVQKAVMAGIPVIAAIGAPSSLAISLAEEEGVTLIGFLREGRYNVYTHPHRIDV
ncbi:MAG: formate dehydrogenase accessory sulfurtransferase FdhD [Bacteroidetes bacterium]|nr:formate dehydrogenase accessory sulfurtransferase FdhD [Bacteroidota bacterium]